MTAVFSTTNYDMFSLIEWNRKVDRDFVDKIIADIRAGKNLLPVQPINVTSNFEVVDGQHRLAAAQACNVPIYYIISDLISPDDIASHNQEGVGRTTWSPEDYLHLWIVKGNENYIRLKAFSDEFPFLGMTSARDLCNWGTKKDRAKIFNAGDYQMNDEPFARQVCENILDFKPLIGHWNHHSFMKTVGNLTANRHYDHKRMMQKMKYLSTKLVKCPTMEMYFSVINDIYNYRATKGFRVELRQLYAGRDPDYRIDRKENQK